MKHPVCPKCSEPHAPPLPECRRYQGWTNYETWCVHLWLSNEQELANAATILARPGTLQEAEDRLKDYVDHLCPDLGPSFAADLLQGALAEVCWREVAEAFRE